MAVTVTVEDGSVVSGANSYQSVAGADSYFANRPDTDWTNATTAEKGEALIRATDYLVQRYRQRWKGFRMDPDQTLDWPRGDVYTEPFYLDTLHEVADDTVPQKVKDATSELALKHIKGETLNPDLTRGDRVKRVKVGTLEQEYSDYAPGGTTYQDVAGMLAPFLRARKNKLVRA